MQLPWGLPRGGSTRRRFRRPWTAQSGLVVLLLASWTLFRAWQVPPETPFNTDPVDVRVARAVDGDTLLLVDGRRVRLIGVNCPESVKPDAPVEPWGPEASAFTAQWLAAAGMRVKLEFDRERVDSFQRQLAYVWVGDRLLQAELLEAGLARFEPQFHYSGTMKTLFRRKENEARQEGRGIWSSPDPAKRTPPK